MKKYIENVKYCQSVDWRQKLIVVRVEDKPFLDRLMIENDRNICGKKCK